MTEISNKSFFEFGVVEDTSKIIGSVLKDGLIKANNSNIFIKSDNTTTPAITIGTNNKVAIGKNIANEAFDVSGSLIANEYRIKNQSYPIIDVSSNITALGNLDISGNLTLNSNKFIVNSSTGNLSVAGTLDISKNININNNKTIIDLSGNIKSQGNFDLSNNININNFVLADTSGSVIMNNTLDISNNATLRSSLDIKGNIKSNAFTTNSSINKISIRNTSLDPSYNLHVTGSTRLEGNLDVDGNIIIVDTVQQTSEQFIINNDGNTVALTINQIGAQPIIDLRDDNKSVFYLADNGLLGLGTTTPSYTVDVSGSCYVQQTLDVSGNLNIGGNTYMSENIQFNDILDVSRNLNINNKFFVDPSGNVDICGNMLIYGYLISNGNNANSGGFQQDGNTIVNGELRVLYNIDISQNLRVLDTFIVDTSGNIKSKGTFDLSNNLRNGSNFNINTVGNVYSSGNIDISKNFNINNGVFSADVSGNIIVNGFIDISKNLYVNGNKFTIDQNGNITAMGNLDLSQNLTINTNKFIVDTSGNIKSVSNLDISNNFIINNGTFKIDNNGNISSQNNFDISGNMSINGSNMTISNTGNIKSIGTLDISNNFSINNDKFKVDSSGNTIAKGNIDISNNLSIGNNKFIVDVSGNIKSSGTLDISKNLKIGNTMLTVDYQNKRVGVNTTTPGYSLDISGQLVTKKNIMGSTSNIVEEVSAVIKMNNTTVSPTTIGTNEYLYAFTSTTDTYTFTCMQNITCDILMIGGGGGGSSGGGTIQSNTIMSSVRKYPPTALSGTTNYSDTERSQGFTIRQASGTPSYGAGNYTIYSSGWWNMDVEMHRNSKTPMKIFNGNLDSEGWLSKVSSGNTGYYYEDSVGNYYGSDFIVNNYKGEWIKLKLPVSIYLSYIKLWGDNNGSTQFIPRNFKIYGSNDDGVTWIDIINVTENSVSPCQTNDTHIISDNGVKRNTVAYNFYAIVISVGPRFVSLGELEFWGSEAEPIIGGGGGGGAGSLIFLKSITMPIGIYTFSVGNGGAKGTSSTSGTGNKGGNTKIILNDTHILVAEGGGAGGGGNTTIGNGGSGGGGDAWTSVGSNGIANPGLATNPGSNIFSYNGVTGVKYGNNGGIVDTTINIGSGGGGAGINGYANTNNQGVYRAFGGDGRNNAIINNITYDFVTVFGTTLYGINNDNNNTRYFAGGGGASGVTIQGNTEVISSIRKYPPTALSGTTDYNDTERSQGFTTRQTSGTPTYGAGNYTIYSSGWWNMDVEMHRNGKTPMKIFNGILDSDGWLSKVSSGNTGYYYEDSVGNYYGSDFIVNNYKGEWIKLKLPVSIYLSYIKLWGDNNGSTQFIPRNFKIYGSNDDGVTWIDIINVTGNSVSPCQTNDTHVISDNGVKRNTVAYNFYAIVISVGPRFVALGELEFWGSEVITSASNTWLGSYGGKGGGGGTNNTGGIISSGANNTGSGGAGGNVNISSGDGGSGIILLKFNYSNLKIYNTIYSNDATFGYRNTNTTFIPSIVQLNTGQTYINSLAQYINFNFGNDNKCKMDSSGNLILNGDIFIYSDGRIKENVTTITSALDKVNELSGITYNIINKSKREIGVIAQEVELVLPEVIKEEDGLKTVAYPNMVGLLIEALKELNDKVDQSI